MSKKVDSPKGWDNDTEKNNLIENSESVSPDNGSKPTSDSSSNNWAKNIKDKRHENIISSEDSVSIEEKINNFGKKKFIIIVSSCIGGLLLIAVLMILTFGFHIWGNHNWINATCEEPQICAGCGKIGQQALGHTWADATCETPRNCTRCGLTSGNSLGHKWKQASCEEARVCSACGSTDGKALGHDWVNIDCTKPQKCSRCDKEKEKVGKHKWTDATCTDPKTCSVCGKTDGKAKGHDWESASCTAPKTCKKCKKTEGKAAGHKWLDATYISPKICKVCDITKGDSLLPPDNRETIFSEGSKYENDGVHLTGTIVNKWILDVDSDGQDELIVHYDTGDNIGDFWDIYEEYGLEKTVWDFGYMNCKIELVENDSGNYELLMIYPNGSKTKIYPETQSVFPGDEDNSYSVPVTVIADHGFNTYDENGNYEPDHSIGTNDDCYIDAVYENDFVHVNYPVPGGRRWAYAKLEDFNYLN